MRWLLLTRKLDPTDDRTGFMLRWVEALAARLDRLDVICQEQRTTDLPPNVRAFSLGKERGAGRAAQALALTRHLRALVPQADGVFCHMIARYALFAAPWARMHRKPLLLWYTHRQTSAELRLATALASHVLTAAPGSFPLRTPKVRVMGHGIDAAQFPPPQPEASPPEIVMIGRLSRIKRQDWLLRAASMVTAMPDAGPFHVRLIGGDVEHEPGYPTELRNLAAALEPAPPVEFVGPLSHAETLSALAQSAIAVNLTPAGSFDKAALEPMFAGKPTIVTNPDFLPLLGEHVDALFLPDNAGDDALAGRLAALLALSPDERAAIGADLRARALAAHSLDGLMDRIVALMRQAAGHA